MNSNGDVNVNVGDGNAQPRVQQVEFRLPRRHARGKDDAREYVVRVEPKDHYTLYHILLAGVEIRKQISRPSPGDCEQGESDHRAKVRPAGFSA